jgi:hypothetical protein
LRANFPELPLSTPLQTPKFPEFPQFSHLPGPSNVQTEILEILARAKKKKIKREKKNNGFIEYTSTVSRGH